VLNDPSPPNQNQAITLWRSFLILALLQFLTAVILTTTVPFNSENSLSRTHFIIIAAVLILSLPVFLLLIETWLNTSRANNRIEKILHFLWTAQNSAWVLLLSGVIFLATTFFITLIPEISEPFTRAIFLRLFTFAALAACLSFQFIAVLVVLRYPIRDWIAHSEKRVFMWVLAVLALSFAVWGWLGGAVIPQNRFLVGWNYMGVPVMEYQLLLAWLAGMGVLALTQRANARPDLNRWLSKIKPARLDLALSLLIWLTAVLIWSAIPVQPNWFVTNKTAPNHEFYPSSDARIYDLVAQSALVGEGYLFDGDFNIRRPLHGMYLTILRLISGQDYDKLVSLQVLVMAFFPVLMYGLVRAMHGRVSAVIAAGLVIFREANAILLSGNITTANAKLLMVDLPTAILVVLFFLIVFKWLDQMPDNPLWGLVSGQSLGLAILVRPEISILIFVFVLILFLRSPVKSILPNLGRQFIPFLVGMVLVLSPWVYRNWAHTGQIYLNEPYFRYALILQRFNPAVSQPPEETLPKTPTPDSNPTATAVAPSSKKLTPKEAAVPGTHPPASADKQLQATPTPVPLDPVKSGQETALQFLTESLQNPAQIVQVAAAHYLNSQMQHLLILPATWRGFDSLTAFLGHRSFEQFQFDCCSAVGYIRRLPYWPKWPGNFALQSLIPILLNIFILAVGIQTAWNRHRWLGLFPLMSSLVYLAANAAFRNSGGRYILPVDWVTLAYFSIGLARLSIAVINLLRRSKVIETWPAVLDQSAPALGVREKKWHPALLAGIFFSVSLMIPVVEKSFPRLYPNERQERMLNALFESEKLATEDQQNLRTFLENGAFVAAGRILYPQYYAAGTGSLGKEDSPIEPLPFARLTFKIVGKEPWEFTLPVKQKSARPVPNAASGLVIACSDGITLALGIYDSNDKLKDILLTSPFPSQHTCPLDSSLNDSP